jgi:excisionase family DNA binding protein
MEQREYTVQEAAARLGYHPGHVRRLILAGELGARRIGARVLVIPATEVERLARRGRQRPGPKPRRQSKHDGGTIS